MVATVSTPASSRRDGSGSCYRWARANGDYGAVSLLRIGKSKTLKQAYKDGAVRPQSPIDVEFLGELVRLARKQSADTMERRSLPGRLSGLTEEIVVEIPPDQMGTS